VRPYELQVTPDTGRHLAARYLYLANQSQTDVEGGWVAANSPNKSQIFPPFGPDLRTKADPGNVCLVFELSLSISVPIDIMSSAKVPLPYFRLHDPKVWRSSHPKVMPFHSTPVQSPICVCCSSDPLADRRTATQPVNVFGGFFDFAQVAGIQQV
jgi:hypothetical protein